MDMTKLLNTSLAQLKPSAILAFSHEVQQIPDIANFTVGEPDFNTPQHVKQAAIDGINADHSHYAPSNGTSELRQAVVDFLESKYHQHYDSEEVIITAGASEGIYTAIMSVINAGDQVIIPTPTFPLYIADVILAGGEPILVDTSADDFKLTPQALQKTLAQNPNVRMLVLNSPSNPTGVVYTQQELDALADVVRDQPIFILSDEIYSELTYTQDHSSIARALPEQTILITGLSKSHAMTGWRIGIMCAPAAITQELSKIHQFTITSTATITQDAALAALTTGKNDALSMKKEYQARRQFIKQELTDMGFECLDADGAFYLFAKIAADLDQDDAQFAQDLAKSGKVAAVPGSYFGPGGKNYLRFSYATSMEELQRGMKLMRQYIQNLRA